MRRALTHRLLGVGLVAALAACARAPAEPPPFAVGVPVRASIEGSDAAALVVVVDVPGAPETRRIELPVSAGKVTGVVPMEPGTGRIVSARVLDAHGLVTHAGERRVDVREDARTAFAVELAPRAGRAALIVVFGPAGPDRARATASASR